MRKAMEGRAQLTLQTVNICGTFRGVPGGSTPWEDDWRQTVEKGTSGAAVI